MDKTAAEPSKPAHQITVSHIQIQGTRTPYSSRFDDIYFAEDSGIEESRYVYLEGNDLPSRFAGPCHIIGEIGFGVGLNFLLTVKNFLESTRPHQRLIYYSAEQYPIHHPDLKKLYVLYPELERESQEMLNNYPVLTPGLHSIRMFQGRITLNLLLGPAEEMFSKIDASIQTWFWDGFAPTKNPDAFSESLFKVIRARSAPNAHAASFTSAGWVRRGIESAGFKIEKRVGFGRKRECIRATLMAPGPNEPITADTGAAATRPAWFSNQRLKTADPDSDVIAVHGAGLAGSSVARALAERGFRVTVFDPNGIANKTSGNRAALFNVQMSRLPNPISRFTQAALVRFLRELKSYPELAVRFGILREDEETLACLMNSNYPEDFYQKGMNEKQVFLPMCGILSPAKLCEARLKHPNIQMLEKSYEPADGSFAHHVYCFGSDLPQFLSMFPTRPIRGQVIEVRATSQSRQLDTTRVHSGYVTPITRNITGNEHHLIGATYQAKKIADDQESIDDAFLVQEAKKNWPEFFSNLTPSDIVSRRVGYRLSTPDKLPLIGPLVDPSWLEMHYRRALKGMKTDRLPDLQVRPGEWCLLGLGSRGVTFSSLGAEIIANLMTGQPLPIEQDLWHHLHSVRFFIRSLRKNDVI